MSSIANQLGRHFDELGWNYQANQPLDYLQVSFMSAVGGIHVLFRPIENQALMLEATQLALVSLAEVPHLLTLAWHLDTVNASRDPASGELRARLLMPVPFGRLDPAILSVYVDLLITGAVWLRVAIEAIQQGMPPAEVTSRARLLLRSNSKESGAPEASAPPE